MMQAFTSLSSSLLPIDRPNVDTDAIIPKQYLKSIRRSGFGPNLFDDWRYLDAGEPDQSCEGRRLNPEFILNDERYRNAEIILGRENFGCGSSREHAVWAFQDYGVRALLAPSFADIFFSNCFKNGLLPIVLEPALIDELFIASLADAETSVSIDLESQTIIRDGKPMADFEVDEFKKHCLLNGLDEIGITLKYAEKIKAFEAAQKNSAPWLYSND